MKLHSFRIMLFCSFMILSLSFMQPFLYAAETPPGGGGQAKPPHSPETTPSTHEVQLDRDYLKGYLTDTAYILSSPSRWTKNDWFTVAAVSTVIAGLYAYDQDIRDWTLKRRGVGTDFLSRAAKPFGEGLYMAPALGIFCLYGYAADDSQAKRTALLGIESFLISGALTQAVKYATHRHTPDEANRYDKWDGPGFSRDHLSFPSGHAQTAFSIATVIASEYDHAAVAPVAYGIAALTALSRINDNAHWASDVLLGSAIGFFTAKTIVKLHKKRSPWTLGPAVIGDSSGLAMNYRF